MKSKHIKTIFLFTAIILLSFHYNLKAFEKENLSVYKNFGNGVILFERMDN